MQDSQTRKLDQDVFNEAYLMHTSTSPQYAIIASCDVAAAMMEPPGGTALVEESICEALDFRRAMRKVDEEYGDDWWFKVWGPDKLAEEGIGTRDDWMHRATGRDAGTASASSPTGFNMLDPIKATIITPGAGRRRRVRKTGIPAAIVTKYLAEHGVIVEKTGLYSFFIMFTIGITKGRWNTLLTALQQFKDDYDKNQPLWRILPEFCRASIRATSGSACATCASRSTSIYKTNDVARLTTEMYLSRHGAGDEAGRRLCQNGAPRDRARPDRRTGRAHHHHPGDALPAGHSAADPRRALQQDDRRLPEVRARVQRKFPGFETDIHGLVEDVSADGKTGYFADCVPL